MATLLDDVRWALRYARRRPAFAIAVAATLSMTIGAATAAFGVATAVLWRPLPFTDASRLVFVWEEVERDSELHASRVTGSRYAAWRNADNGFASMSLFGAAGFTMDTPAGAISIRGVRVSGNYFDTLGLQPALGRTFTPADGSPGNHRVVILSHAFWRERLGGRPEAVGETLRLSGEPYTIVGVMPAVAFPAWPVNPAAVTLDPDSRQLWVPIPATPALDASSRAHVFGVLARLAPGVSAAEAIDRLNRTSHDAAPDAHRARLMPLREQLIADARTPIMVLGCATLALLLIACANLAALFAAAFEARRGELAVRAALGAAAPRLVRQLAIEAAVLVSCAAAGGLVIAQLALARVAQLSPASLPLLTRPAVDVRVVVFAIAAASVAVLLLAGWPAARMMTAAPMPRSVAAPPRQGIYRVLVVSQVAITVALATAAGLLTQSFQAVRRQHPGFTLDRVLLADVGLPATPTGAAQTITTTEQRLLAAIARLPHVRGVAAAYDHPLEANWSEVPVVVGDVTPEDRRQQAELRIVSPGYFEALGVELLQGRQLTDQDDIGARGAAVVNEAFARTIGGHTLGRRIRSGTPRLLYRDAPEEFEIVGVVNNERFHGLDAPAQPAFYLSTRQFPQTTFVVLVRTAGEPLAFVAQVRSAVRSVDAAITFDRPTSLDRVLGDQLMARRVTTHLVGGFAMAAVALAALGIFGLLAMSVGSRTREIGVRVAVGASPVSIARRVVIDSLQHVGVGIVLGCALALSAGHLLQGLLVGVSARDPVTLGAVMLVLIISALAAAFVPARRAARIDPIAALRAEP